MSSARDNGGPAFPQDERHDNGELFRQHGGMTLRDWFAGQALAGMLAFPGAVNGSREKSGVGVARAAYVYADAMLAERQKP